MCVDTPINLSNHVVSHHPRIILDCTVSDTKLVSSNQKPPLFRDYESGKKEQLYPTQLLIKQNPGTQICRFEKGILYLVLCISLIYLVELFQIIN